MGHKPKGAAGHHYLLKASIDKRQSSTAIFYLHLLELQQKRGKKEERDNEGKKKN